MSWVPFALAILKVAYSIMSYAREHELVSDGYDKAVADQALAVLRTTTEGKRLLEKLDALTPSQLDDVTDAIGNSKPS